MQTLSSSCDDVYFLRIVGWLDEWLDGWLNGWLNGWMVGRMNKKLVELL